MLWTLIIIGFILFSIATTITIILILKNRKTTPPCVPDCATKTCGDDGCGGSCGACCTPDCKDKTCGSDGCGGSCGNCTGTATCHAGACCTPGSSGCCTPNCEGKTCGDDGCGGSCG